MAKKKFEVRPGHEVRGLMVRLYPDAETEEKLSILAGDCRVAWNFLVKQVEDALAANEAYAVRNKLVDPRPERPNYDGLSPEDSRRAREDFRVAMSAWKQSVFEATRNIPECALRKFKDILAHFGCKHDYQLLARVIGWSYPPDAVRVVKPGAHMLQAIAKNYFQKKPDPSKGKRRIGRKRFRRSIDPMPVQVRSGSCFFLGNYGARGKNENFYNCLVKINGLSIRGRLPGRVPEGRVLEGVSLTKHADGWWASIKQEVPIRQLESPVPGTVMGLDVGLDVIVAMSDGARIENKRNRAYAERIAGRQAMKLPTQRLEQAAAKNIKHIVYNDVIKKLAHVEVIKVEKLPQHIGQMGSQKKSYMRTVVSLLRERYGARVVEVMPHYTSQDCSECGHRSKESWSYDHGRYGKCPACGFSCDRDVNAARNIARRPAIVASAEPDTLDEAAE